MYHSDSNVIYYHSGTVWPLKRRQSTPNILHNGVGDGLVPRIARRPTRTSTKAHDSAWSRSWDPARRIGTWRKHAVGVAKEQLSGSAATSTRMHYVCSQVSATSHDVKTNNRQTLPEQAAAHFGTFCREMGNQLSLQPDMRFLPKDRRDTRRRGVRGTCTGAVPLSAFSADLYLFIPNYVRALWYICYPNYARVTTCHIKIFLGSLTSL